MTEPTLGMQRVRADFNPSDDDLVGLAKTAFAALIDMQANIMAEGVSDEAARCLAISMTKIEEAAMWSVKGITAGFK